MIRKKSSVLLVLAMALTQLLPSVGRSAEGNEAQGFQRVFECFSNQFRDPGQCYNLSIGIGFPGPNETATPDSVARQVNGFCDSIQDRHVLCEDRGNTTELFYELSKVSAFKGPFSSNPVTMFQLLSVDPIRDPEILAMLARLIARHPSGDLGRAATQVLARATPRDPALQILLIKTLWDGRVEAIRQDVAGLRPASLEVVQTVIRYLDATPLSDPLWSTGLGLLSRIDPMTPQIEEELLQTLLPPKGGHYPVAPGSVLLAVLRALSSYPGPDGRLPKNVLRALKEVRRNNPYTVLREEAARILEAERK